MNRKSREKIGNIVKYTVERNIRNKWFIILNAIILVISVVALNFNTVKTIMKENDINLDSTKLKIEIVDTYDLIYNDLLDVFSNGELKDKVELTKVNSVSYDEKTLEKEKLIVEVKESKEHMLDVKMISKEGIDSVYINTITQVANEKKNELYANKYNLSIEEVESIIEKINIERVMVGVDSANSDMKTILQTVVNYLILFMLMIVLSKIANDVSQEKVSKSIEYVLTTISAKAYLIAKVISINLTLIAQLVLGVVYFLIASSINSLLNMFITNPSLNIDTSNLNISADSLLSVIDTNIIFYMLVIFVFALLTVLILCVIQAALSSRTTNISEASNATILLVVINLVIYMVSSLAISPIKEANILMYILSCIPVVSMYFIPSMMLIGQANIIQIIIAFVLLVVSVPFVFKYSAKFFKEGVLGNNTKKKVKEEVIEKSVRQIQEEYVLKKDFSRYGFVIGVSVLLFIVLQLVLSVVVIPVVSAIATIIPISSSNISTISTIIAFVISLVVPALFVMAYIQKDDSEFKELDSNEINRNSKESVKLKIIDNIKKVDIKLWIKSILVVVPLVILVQIGLSILLEILGLNYDIVEKTNLYDSSSVLSKILFFVQIAILPAIFEELYIRKAVLNYSKKYGTVFAIISSSLLFSLIHLNISQSLFAFIMGVILAVVAIRTKSIIPTAIIHFLNNGYAAIVTIFEDNMYIVAGTNIFMLLLCLSGIVITIVEVTKNRIAIKNCIMKIIKKNEDENKEESVTLDSVKVNNNGSDNDVFIQTKLSKGYKYILLDYSFIVSVILVFVMLLLTQNMLSML